MTVDDDRPIEIATRNIARARLAEIKPPKPVKPAKHPKAPRTPQARPEGATAPRTGSTDHDVRSDAPESAAARDER
jgi:hypothetical protein